MSYRVMARSSTGCWFLCWTTQISRVRSFYFPPSVSIVVSTIWGGTRGGGDLGMSEIEIDCCGLLSCFPACLLTLHMLPCLQSTWLSWLVSNLLRCLLWLLSCHLD